MRNYNLFNQQTGELDHLVLADHDLLDEVAVAQLDEVGPVECRTNLPTEDQGQPFDALEVGVFDRHDTGVGEQLLRVIVDQLPVVTS